MRNPAKLVLLALVFWLCSLAIFSGQIFTAEDENGNLIASDRPITAEQKKAEMENALTAARQQAPVTMAGANVPTMMKKPEQKTVQNSIAECAPYAIPQTQQQTEKFVDLSNCDSYITSGVDYKPIGPKIKGLQIGMSVKDAIKNVFEKFPRCKIEQRLDYFYVTMAREGSNEQNKLLDIRRKGENNQVCELSFIWDGMIFNTSDMSREDFVKNVVKSYAIPHLKFSYENSSYDYSSDNGWAISVDTHKQVFLKEIGKASERKMD